MKKFVVEYHYQAGQVLQTSRWLMTDEEMQKSLIDIWDGFDKEFAADCIVVRRYDLGNLKPMYGEKV